jgi:hypothetical protein
VFGGDFLAPIQLVRLAREQLEAFENANLRTNGLTVQPTRTMVEESWKSPPVGCFKVNWDATLERRNAKMGWGVIARDHEGSVVAMACGSRDHIKEPTTENALAAREAVELCSSWGLRKFILEGDALVVIQASYNKRRTVLGTLWPDYK